MNDLSYTDLLCNPTNCAADPITEKSQTWAVVRNGAQFRVGSVASVVATTSRIAIQGVVIPECTLSRQYLAQNIFWKRHAIFSVRAEKNHLNTSLKDCDDRQHESHTRSWCIGQCSIDEALHHRLQETWNRCDRDRFAQWKSRTRGPSLHQGLRSRARSHRWWSILWWKGRQQ